MNGKPKQEYIVAEVSKSWPNSDQMPLGRLFEQVINVNYARGYELFEFQFSQCFTDGLLETIVAVFRRIEVKS